MRTEVILALAVALPTITALVGVLLSQSNYSKLDVRLAQVESRLDGCISAIKSELDARITALENRFHSDMMMVIGKLTELEVRVAKLEEKQSR
ncbi:hypothetical protein [Terriglobus sp.]|uniref:hypothetical protein n=1 Tax=Terriglobus sp. TaxID=1889013 RepID=UPI003B009A71